MGRNVDNIGGVAQAAANLGSPVNRRNIRFMDGGGVAWTVVDDPGNDEVEVSCSASGAGVPSGSIVAKASTVIPAGWLECNGASYLTATHPALYADIGYFYGGAGANFNVPNFARRVLMGRGGAGTGVIGNAVGNVGGAETHVITPAEMTTHAHGGTVGGSHVHNTTDGTIPIASDGGPGGSTFIELLIGRAIGSPANPPTGSGGFGTITGEGGSVPHNNVQPSAIVMWIIKT